MYRQELWFLRSAPRLMILYISMKFNENILKGFQVTEQTWWCLHDRWTDGWTDRWTIVAPICLHPCQGGDIMKCSNRTFTVFLLLPEFWRQMTLISWDNCKKPNKHMNILNYFTELVSSLKYHVCPSFSVNKLSHWKRTLRAHVISKGPDRYVHWHILIRAFGFWQYPAGTQCWDNVVSMLMQRHDVASTLMRRCINDICLLGRYLHTYWGPFFALFSSNDESTR